MSSTKRTLLIVEDEDLIKESLELICKAAVAEIREELPIEGIVLTAKDYNKAVDILSREANIDFMYLLNKSG